MPNSGPGPSEPEPSTRNGDDAAADDNWWEGLKVQTIYVSNEAFDELLAMLDEPPRVIPALRRLYERASRFERDGDQADG